MSRHFARMFLAALLVTAGWPEPTQAAGRPVADGSQTPTLQELLEKGLKARRPEEFAFVHRVVELVDDRVLPEKLVQRTFLWARRQPNHPFQYFERAMQVQAARLGIEL